MHEPRDSAYERGNIKVLIATGKCNALFILLGYCTGLCVAPRNFLE